MHRNDGIVGASERPGPRRTGSDTLEIFKHLAGERQRCFQSFATLHADRGKNLNSHFFESEHVAGRNGRGRVVKRFERRSKLNRLSAKSASDGARNADGGRVTFDRKDSSLERRNSYAAECLQGMNRTDSRSARMQ